MSWLSSSYPRLLQIHIREGGDGKWDDFVKKFVKVRGEISVNYLCELCCGSKTQHEPSAYRLESSKWELGIVGGGLAEVSAQVAFSITLKEISAHVVATHLYHTFTDPSTAHLHLPNMIACWDELPEYARKTLEHLSAQPAIMGLKKHLDALGKRGALASHLEQLKEQTKDLRFYSFYQNPGDAGHLLIGSITEEKAKREGLPLHSGLVRILKKRATSSPDDWLYSWVCDNCRRELLLPYPTPQNPIASD
jgi:hypothetical protein